MSSMAASCSPKHEETLELLAAVGASEKPGAAARETPWEFLRKTSADGGTIHDYSGYLPDVLD